MINKFLNEKQDPVVVQQIHERASEILTNDEEVLYIAVQKKIVNVTPISVVLTNKRFIIFKPGLLKSVQFEDYIWRDLHDARLKESLRGATLTLKTVGGQIISVDSLPKDQARRLYTLAQNKEEEMLEERRNRELEEKRAASGGVVVHNDKQGIELASNTQTDPVKKLNQLKEMMDMGLITKEEYESKKTDILSRM